MRTCAGRENYAEYLHYKLPELIELKDESFDPMKNFMNALEVAEDDEAIHLEDDAILANDFRRRPEKSLMQIPIWSFSFSL
jgi:hypothetical protein